MQMNNMKKSLKTSKGITLIVLVITIIVLLILAAVSISILAGDNGIVTRTVDSKKLTDEASALEEIQLQVLGSYSGINNRNYKDLKNNLKKLGISNLYDEEIYPIYLKYKSYDFKIDKYWKVTRGNEVVYAADNLTFNGTSDYVNTNIKLFNEENFDKNFQIRIIVDEFGKDLDNQPTLINSKYEEASLQWPGFVFRNETRRGRVSISMNGLTGKNEIYLLKSELKKKLFTITRINGHLYYNFNGQTEWVYDAKSSVKFDTPVTIGCSLDSQGNPFRFFNGKISKIEIILTNDNMDVEEPQLIYAKLYSDGTLAFSGEDKILNNKNLNIDYGIVHNRYYEKERTEENNTSPLIPWHEQRGQIKTVSFLDEIYPIGLRSWFANCENLERFENINNLNTSKVVDMTDCFFNCKKLNVIDLSNFDTRNVRYMGSLFSKCTNLKTIYVSNKFSTASVSVTTYMFSGCTSIVGGNGTTYNPLNIDITYARIDEASTPGYFTLKTD